MHDMNCHLSFIIILLHLYWSLSECIKLQKQNYVANIAVRKLYTEMYFIKDSNNVVK